VEGRSRSSDDPACGKSMTTKFLLPRVLAAFLSLSLLAALPTAASATGVPAPPASWSLQTELEQYVANLNAVYGVSVVNLANGNVVAVNGEESFPTASMYKLLVMYRVLQAVDAGRLSLDDQITITDRDMAAGDWVYSPGDTPTVGDALNRMITVSSNSA